MKKYGKFAALIVVVIGTLVWLATAEMKENQTYYKTITELGQMGNKAYNARIRVGGDVETGSIQRVGSRVEFVLAQETTKLKVAYTGTDPLPGHLQGRRAGAGRRQAGQGRRLRGRTASRPSAHPSTKPSPGSSSPDRPLPTSIRAKQASSRGVIWKIWVRWPSCWPSVWRCMPPSACVVGRLKNKPFLIVSGERAVYGIWALIATASGILVYALMTSDFRFAYVAEHSNRTMPILYKYAAWWGGQEGSLLLWSFLLSTYAVGRGLHQPAQAPRHDAVGDRRPDHHPDPSSCCSTTSSPTRSRCWPWTS